MSGRLLRRQVDERRWYGICDESGTRSLWWCTWWLAVWPAAHRVGRCLRAARYCHCWCCCHSLDCITHQEVNTTCKEGLRSSLLSNLLSKRALDCAPKPFVYVDDCVKLVCSFEFFEETGVVFGEHAEVADAILQVGDALDTHTEGVA